MVLGGVGLVPHSSAKVFPFLNRGVSLTAGCHVCIIITKRDENCLVVD